MTRVDKSPEQLNAEATRGSDDPRAPLEDRDLDAAIAAHRLLFQAETGILKLHQRDGESGIGPPFNPVFAAYLDERYYAFPWSKSLLFLRWNVCRRTHAKHWERAEWRGSLCFELVNYVIRRESSVDYARLQLGLPDAGKTRRTLDSALLVIERHLEALLADDKPEVRREPQEWMATAHVHQRLDGLHGEDCPQCRRNAA